MTICLKSLAGVAMFAVCLSVSFVPANAQSQYVIIGAEPVSEDFKPGRVLKPVTELNIPGGTIVTLLGEDGSVHKIPGPAAITVTEDDISTANKGEQEEGEQNRSTLAKIAGLLAGDAKSSDSLGVARNLGSSKDPKGLADPWVLSVHRSGQGCVKGNNIVLGRANDASEVSFSAKADEGEERNFMWAKGDNQFVLPEAVATASKELYLRITGSDVLIDLHKLPDDVDPANPMAVMGWMVEQGCEGQALAFARDLAKKAE
ncbi:MAG: hypothetical protein KDJ67_11225 [Nitratireductor sp.]|nr:hypothetical protein [Nitratireductor sp.]